MIPIYFVCSGIIATSQAAIGMNTDRNRVTTFPTLRLIQVEGCRLTSTSFFG